MISAGDNALGDVPARLRPVAAWLQRVCRDEPAVACAYLDGSLATGRVDAHSDLDASLFVTSDASAALFDTLLARLSADWPVIYRWVLPLPTWHGGRQVFAGVRVPDEPDPVVLDLVVSDLEVDAAGQPAPILVDPRRDGTPLVLHDPAALVQVREHGDADYRAAADEAIRQLADKFPVARWLVEKSIRRELWPEAYSYYLRFALEPTVLLLRARAIPSRWDFGLRYLDTDLPAAERDRVVALLPRDPASLEALAKQCLAWQEQLLAEAGASAAGGQ